MLLAEPWLSSALGRAFPGGVDSQICPLNPIAPACVVIFKNYLIVTLLGDRTKSVRSLILIGTRQQPQILFSLPVHQDSLGDTFPFQETLCRAVGQRGPCLYMHTLSPHLDVARSHKCLMPVDQTSV